jgi:hypothetical protein
MAAKTTKSTTDHEVIRAWVEERGGTPVHVKGTGGRGDVGMLRIDFPGYSGEGKLEPVDWEDWFAKFDESGLAFLYQDETAGGERSNFNKLVSRSTLEERTEHAHERAKGHEPPGKPASAQREVKAKKTRRAA